MAAPLLHSRPSFIAAARAEAWLPAGNDTINSFASISAVSKQNNQLDLSAGLNNDTQAPTASAFKL